MRFESVVFQGVAGVIHDGEVTVEFKLAAGEYPVTIFGRHGKIRRAPRLRFRARVCQCGPKEVG